MSLPTSPNVADAPERLTIPVNLALDSIAFVDWVRTTIPAIAGGTADNPPERFEIIELGLLSLYNYIMNRVAEEVAEQEKGQSQPVQEVRRDGG